MSKLPGNKRKKKKKEKQAMQIETVAAACVLFVSASLSRIIKMLTCEKRRDEGLKSFLQPAI
jgi:hypothetical protein